MDRKSIIVLVITFVLLVAWFPLVNKLYPPKTITSANPTNQLGKALSTPPDTNAPVPPKVTPIMEPVKTSLSPVAADTQTPEVLEKVDVGNIVYIFTSHGGGLKNIELKDYPEVIQRQSKTAAQTVKGTELNRHAPMPVLSLGGHPTLTDDGIYKLTRKGTTITAEKTLANGLRIIKEFRPGNNYLVTARVTIENHAGENRMVPSQQFVVGTTTLINAKDDPLQMGAFVNASGTTDHLDDMWFANRFLGCFPGTPRERYETATTTSWAAVHNRFFTIATIPTDGGPHFMAEKVDVPGMIASGAKVMGIQASLIYPSTTLSATGTNSAVERHFTIYAGPKEYNTLSKLAAEMKNDLDHIMKFNGFFGWFSKGLLLSMNWIHDRIKLSYGWAIILITILIKLAFWPLTQASTRSMKRMATMQPQMKAIQDKYKDDPQKMNKKLMEFMKENKVNPMGGCLPMLIQIPVFFGFYYMIQSAIELRGASFLWAWDLSQADTVATLFGFSVNPMPLIMGATMFWQAQLTPPSPGMDPTQQKVMKYMPLIFLFILYGMSAGLTLYWTVQNLLTIVQTMLTKTNDPAPVALAPVARKK